MAAATTSTAPAETRTEPIVLRRRPVVGAGSAFCSHCWEPIAHDGETWRHVRTGLPAAWNNKACAPICDWPDCQTVADAGRSLGKDEWTGAAFRWRAAHFLCDDHWREYRRNVFTIDRA